MILLLAGIIMSLLINPIGHRAELQHFIGEAKAPALRSLRQFMEQELILAAGPFAGCRFRVDTQPFTGLFLDAVDSGQFNRIVATGPAQASKSTLLTGAILHVLFELGQNAILSAPVEQILVDKWTLDIRPIIERTRFAKYLPRSGRGSEGGWSPLITFGNGTALKGMTGGGRDSSRAAFTCRNVFVTEVDGFKQSETSLESDPIAQVIARARAYGQHARVFLEGTRTGPRGRISQELQRGTCSRIVLQCPHCDVWGSPEREHFVGWEPAKSELQAEESGRWSCPSCGGLWSPKQRIQANRSAKLVHRGQEILPDGTITGPVPETRTFSMRWSAVNNLFLTEAQLANEEWNSAREEDVDNATRKMLQQVYCVPFSGTANATELSPEMIASRLSGLERFVAPDDTEVLAVQVDCHDRYLAYCVTALAPNNIRSIVDYGFWLNPHPEKNGAQTAIRLGLEQLSDHLDTQPYRTVSGKPFPIDIRLVDGGYQQTTILAFAVNCPGRWFLTKGEGDEYKRPQPTPGKTSVSYVGEHWHTSVQPSCEESKFKKWQLVIAEKGHFLHVIQNGFTALPFADDGSRRPNSLAIFGTDPEEHLTPLDQTISRSAFATQIYANEWKCIETNRGMQWAWRLRYAQDHLADCLYGSCVGLAIGKAFLPRFKPKTVPTPPVPKPSITKQDGRSWLTSRDEFSGRQ